MCVCVYVCMCGDIKQFLYIYKNIATLYSVKLYNLNLCLLTNISKDFSQPLT